MIRLGSESTFQEVLQALDFSDRVNTAFIERVNLTIWRGVAALAHRTWAAVLHPHIWKHISSGGSPGITSCGRTGRCA